MCPAKWVHFSLSQKPVGMGGQDGRQVGEDVIGEEGEFGQALTALGSENELTMEAEHLFGS